MTKVYVDGAYGTVAIELKGHLLRLCENGVISEIIEIPYEKPKDVSNAVTVASVLGKEFVSSRYEITQAQSVSTATQVLTLPINNLSSLTVPDH